MALLSKILRLTKARRIAANPLSENRGNVLIYVVLVMVIFGLLGVTMVSLFSTSISSSGTRNDTRRSFYMAESGIRYGVSQLRSKDFESKDIDDLNTTTFKLPPLGEFKINVFGPWFESPSDQNLAGSGSLNLRVTEGKIPSAFLSQISTGDSNFRLVNRDYINFDPNDPNMRFRPPETGIAQVLGFTEPIYPFTSFQLNLADDFVVARGEEVCLSIRPTAVQDVTVGGNFKLPTAARNIFPRLGGTFEIRKRNFSYREAREITGGIELRDIQPVSGETSVTEYNIQTDEGIILTSRNHMVTAEGKYGDVVYPATASFAAAIADRSVVKAKSRKPDIEFAQEEFLDSKLNQVEPLANTSFIDVDNAARSLRIGGGNGPSLGAVWFKDTRSIGGQNRFCQETGFGIDQNLGCFFNEGIRVFFTLEYAGSGDGLVFTLINGNPAKNDFLSAGGDIERSEMLGYAGDSRLSVTGSPPPDPPFLDNSGPARGLIPPKIGLEFDTKVNYSSAFEATGAYCASATSLNENTRNDPGTPAADNRDAVQFVYWGASALRAQCRDNNPLYDDNRHEAYGTGDPNWIFDTGGAIQSSPHVAGDGTIYVGSDPQFFAVKPDGTSPPKWNVNQGAVWYSPTVTGTGRIYVGTGAPENRLYALNPTDGSAVSGFPFLTGGPVTTKPAIDSDGNVYFGSDDGNVYAVNSSGIELWRFPTGGPIKSSPALSVSKNTVYVGTSTGTLYALRATMTTGDPPEGLVSIGSTAFQSSPVVGPDGTIYVGNDDGNLYAISESFSSFRSFPIGAPVQSSPALSSDGSTVYIGSKDGILFAFNTSDLSKKWNSTEATGAKIQSPIAVDANGHIYFGSNDKKAYALYADGTLKWSFPTGGEVVTKPAVKVDGTVYVGSTDGKLYAINQFTNPKNYKDLRITSTSGESPVRVGGVPIGGTIVGATGVPVAVDSERDWLKGKSGASPKGPWSVRLEITRSLTLTNGTYAYNLRAWVRQCNSTNCDDALLFDPLGTFFEDTRVQYAPAARPPMIEQTINLSPSDHADFERFIFGFTAQTGASETQTATILKFQLSFIRPNDPTVDSDPGWP